MDEPSSGSTEADPLEPKTFPVYRTTDLNLASFLATRGFQPIQLEPPPENTFPRLAAFVFSRDTDLDEAVAEWTSNTATVGVRDFVERRAEFWQLARAATKEGGR